jgi:hypothetical protein
MAAVAAALLVMYSSAVLPCSAVLQQQLRVQLLVPVPLLQYSLYTVLLVPPLPVQQ